MNLNQVQMSQKKQKYGNVEECFNILKTADNKLLLPNYNCQNATNCNFVSGYDEY